MVETVSMFRMRYVVEAKNKEHAMDEVVMGIGVDGLREFSQHHIDEVISSCREITDKDYIDTFDEDNDYLKSWTDEQKFAFVNKIDYNKQDSSL